MQKCVLVALLASASASRAGVWNRGLKVHRPSSGFLGDVPDLSSGELKKPTSDVAQMDQAEFKATYKQPRAEKNRVSNINVTMNALKEQNTTNTLNTTSAGLKIEEKVAETTRTREAGLKIMTQKEQKETTLATAAAAAAKKADTKADSKSKSRRGRSREVTLIESLQHMGGDEAVGCVTHCRYDEFFRHTWSECLDRCVENRLMRSAMKDMLPEEDHNAHHPEKEVPAALKDQLKKHKARMEEL
eukprot:gnl/MRDRNA2_/MRDRNA2_93511_c0_seq1.p1 gnl/MRDRNA2_/MRDRNA2_93511_c0~~gnl/MRDRNA2_/MRDRNA2_93511_c0_seq1.p1  ORF type:complete len:245 (-),score=60.05 gnl/MRDRNA2_/MRDRNA2_93511_c0_seq1:36-770(-)